MNSFIGRVRLKRDPVQETVSSENMIYRGTRISGANWVMAIAIYTGNDCKIYQSSNYLSRKTTYFYKRIRIGILWTCVLHLTLAITITFLLLARTQQIEYIQEYEVETNSGGRITHNFLLFGPIIPLSLYIFMDLVLLFQSLYYEKRLE